MDGEMVRSSSSSLLSSLSSLLSSLLSFFFSIYFHSGDSFKFASNSNSKTGGKSR